MGFSYLKNFLLPSGITLGFLAFVIVDSILLEEMLIIAILRSIFGLIFLFFCVGYVVTTILFPKGEIDNIERCALSIVLSASIVLLAGMVLGLTPLGLNSLSSTVILCFLALCFSLIKTFQRSGKEIKHTRALLIEKTDYLVIALLLIFSVLLPLRNVLEVKFFHAYDPFTSVAFMNDLIEGQRISYTLPGEPLYYYYYPDFPGFFILSATSCILLGISPFTLVRFGGPLMLAGNVLCIFALVRKIKLNRIFNAVAPFFFCTTPIVVYRFSMTLRENFVLANYVLIVLLLGEAMENVHKKEFVLRRVFAAALLLGAAINSHQSWVMIPFVLLWQFLFGIMFRMSKKELRELFKLVILFIVLSLFIGVLSLPAIINALWGYATHRGADPYIYTYAPVSFEFFPDYFIVPGLLLSIVGIIFLIAKSRKHKSLVFLLIWFLLILFLTQAPRFGINMPGYRFLTYFSLSASVFSSLGLCYVISKFKKRMLSATQFFSIKKELLLRTFVRIILPLLLVAPIAAYSFFRAYSIHGWVAWQPQDVGTAIKLRELVLSHPGAVITIDFGLIYFCNVSNYEPDLFTVHQILGTSSYKQFMSLLRIHYGERFHYVYFFISTGTRNYIQSESEDFTMHLARMELIHSDQQSKIYRVNLSRPV